MPLFDGNSPPNAREIRVISAHLSGSCAFFYFRLEFCFFSVVLLPYHVRVVRVRVYAGEKRVFQLFGFKQLCFFLLVYVKNTNGKKS